MAFVCIAMSDQTITSQPTEKKTRKQTAAHCGLSLRTIDELTRNGTLPFFKIGKAVRYDLNEVENALRQRFHVQAKARKATA
jgi:excisionase family DNA binding protein